MFPAHDSTHREPVSQGGHPGLEPGPGRWRLRGHCRLAGGAFCLPLLNLVLSPGFGGPGASVGLGEGCRLDHLSIIYTMSGPREGVPGESLRLGWGSRMPPSPVL